MENQDNLLGVLSTVVRHRKMLLRFAILAAVLTAGISLLLPNYYASTATFYAASPQLANPELTFGNTGQVTEYYGNEHDLDRLLTIAESNELVDFMIKKFDLYVHYDIDSTKTKAPHKIREHFRKLYSVEKTKADAVEITVEDTDREYAAMMANAAMGRINAIASRLTREGMGKMLAGFETLMTDKKWMLDNYSDTIRVLRERYGIVDVNSQAELLAKMIADAESESTRGNSRLKELEGNPDIPRDTIAYLKADIKAAEKELFDLTDPNSRKSLNLKRFNAGQSAVMEFQDLHFQARKQLSYDIERYKQIQATFKTEIPSIHVVQVAEIPVVKSRPVRSIMVIAATLAALVFGLLAALFAEHYKGVNWSELGRNQ